MNGKLAIGAVIAAGAVITAYALINRQASAGPYGGDLVPLDDGKVYAEVLANQESGELMAHVWDKDLETPHPIPSEPITVGSDDSSTQLMPHPMPNDPAGTCSRFYGHADWVRGGGIRNGWLHTSAHAEHRQQFAWNRCWQGGRAHGAMWQEVQGHHRMGRSGRGPHGGHNGGHE